MLYDSWIHLYAVSLKTTSRTNMSYKYKIIISSWNVLFGISIPSCQPRIAHQTSLIGNGSYKKSIKNSQNELYPLSSTHIPTPSYTTPICHDCRNKFFDQILNFLENFSASFRIPRPHRRRLFIEFFFLLQPCSMQSITAIWRRREPYWSPRTWTSIGKCEWWRFSLTILTCGFKVTHTVESAFPYRLWWNL